MKWKFKLKLFDGNNTNELDDTKFKIQNSNGKQMGNAKSE